MKKHWLWMVLGCGIPLLFIFMAPVFGIKSNLTLFTFIILMFAIHLLMPMKHGNHTHGLSDENLDKKDSTEEHKDGHHH